MNLKEIGRTALTATGAALIGFGLINLTFVVGDYFFNNDATNWAYFQLLQHPNLFSPETYKALHDFISMPMLGKLYLGASMVPGATALAVAGKKK